jgi:hypothetical protein
MSGFDVGAFDASCHVVPSWDRAQAHVTHDARAVRMLLSFACHIPCPRHETLLDGDGDCGGMARFFIAKHSL